jgi:hypothetical protein
MSDKKPRPLPPPSKAIVKSSFDDKIIRLIIIRFVLAFVGLFLIETFFVLVVTILANLN